MTSANSLRLRRSFWQSRIKTRCRGLRGAKGETGV
nr:MAG TPA: hypothetical protein [Caudoviricetes sp.]